MIGTFMAMDPWTILAFMGAAFLLYLTPGADMMFTIASGMSGGPRAGAAAAAGISLGVLVHVALAAVGLAVILRTYPAAYDTVRYAGAAYLAYLAVVSWRAKSGPEARRGRASVARAFRRGFITNILNPKVALFVLAFLPQFAQPEIGPVWQQILALGVLLAIGGFLTDGLIGVFAGLAAHRLSRASRVFNKIAAVVFGGLAARIVLD
ncbi:MAG: LysE family translocator [Litoreibacter sp.]|nr:LysE family translocator [Litoreibacter sp.]